MQVNFNLINFTQNQKKQNFASKPNIGGGNLSQERISAAYQDYNISFGERLFRTPQNFYEQDFNEKNMPKTLHKYIYEGVDSDFKRTIPPAQAMKEAFGAMNYAKDLETIKKLFPNEPLFADLTSKPSKKSREGLLGMINLFKEDPDYVANNRTLFKNGNDDLGLYIVKKIYLEGKTLKEINKDFAKDVSVFYKGYDIAYKDYAAFGIKFPEKPFWKSFIATREDFPYVYIPRTTAERVVAGNKAKSGTTVVSTPVKKRREPMSFVQRKKMSEAMVNWHASMTPDEKAAWLKKLRAGMGESIFHNYLSEIVTIAQDRVDHAGKMAAFFEKVYGDPDYMQSSAPKIDKEKALGRFWKAHQQHRINYSKAMNEVIAEFDKAYGEDGETSEFKELLATAEAVAAKNEENRKLRAEARAEKLKAAEEARKESEAAKMQLKTFTNTPVEPTKKTFAEYISERAKDPNIEIFDFTLEDGTKVAFAVNLQDELKRKISKDTEMLPEEFGNRMYKFILKHPKADKKYLLSTVFQDGKIKNIEAFGVNLPEGFDEDVLNQIQKHLYTGDEVFGISREISKDFFESQPRLQEAVSMVKIEQAFDLAPISDDDLIEVCSIIYSAMEESGDISKDIPREERLLNQAQILLDLRNKSNDLRSNKIAFIPINEYLATIQVLGYSKLSPKQRKYFDDKLRHYQTPLSNSDCIKLQKIILSKMLEFNPKTSHVLGDEELSAFYNAAFATVRKNPKAKAMLQNYLRKNYITSDNSSLRCYLDKDVNPKAIDAKTDRLISEIFQREVDMFKLFAAYDMSAVEKYIRPINPEMYYILKQYNELARLELDGKI